LLQQAGNAIRGLSTLRDPVVNALAINANTLFIATGNRVEETNAFNEATVTTVTAVGYYDLIKGTLFRATARHTDGYHANKFLVITNKRGRPIATRIKIKPAILRRFEKKG
jgi:hypothetical protein